MNNILITGGNGFIGKYVVKNLLDNGYNPIVFDRYRHGDFEQMLGDTRDFTAVNEAVALVDGVIHLAGEYDYHYHGEAVYQYTFASLVLKNV